MSDATYAEVDKSKKKRVKNGPKPQPRQLPANSTYAVVDSNMKSRPAPNEINDNTYDAVAPDNLYYNTTVHSVSVEDPALYDSASAPAYSKLERGQIPQPVPVTKAAPEPSTSGSPTNYEFSRLNYQQDKILPPEKKKNDGKSSCWMLTCLVILAVAVAVAILLVIVAFALIASLKSEIGSLGLETSTAQTGSLESRFNMLEFEITNFMETSRVMLMQLTDTTSGRVNSLEGDVATAFILATTLPGLLNNTHEKITTLQNQLTIKIDVLSANVTTETLSISSILSGEADQAIRTTEGFVNSSAIQLATDIRALHVFESCDIVSGLRFPFPTGTYRIGPSQDNYSLMNCSTSTALTCNGISGQWRRVAYLDTNQTNIECPGSLQGTNNPPSCRIFGSSPTCSSAFFSSGGLPYSQVCGRIYGRYSLTPDAFDTFPVDRPAFPTINDNYVDGVSLSYGMNPRNHVWTLAVTIPQRNRIAGCTSCNFEVPGFVGSDYSCQIVPECSLSDDSTCRLVEVWNDDNQCNGNSTFYRNLTQTTTENLEMRLCRDQPTSDEDISISFIEIFVSAP